MSIRILHFDTSLLDAQMTWLTLKGDELQPEIEHVESFEEFEEALEEQSFDLVLCEYALQKRKTANDVIAYLKSKSIQVPVIVLSKITDEGVVADVLKAGASDYVFKSHLNFLPTSIKEVLNKKTISKPEPQLPPMPSQEFLKNLEAVRAQLARLQSPFLEDEPSLAPTTEKEPHKPAVPHAPSQVSSSAVMEEMHKKIDELTETVATLNTRNLELQNALDEARLQLQSIREEKASKEEQLESELAELNKTVETLNTKNLELQNALEQSFAQIESLKANEEKNAHLESQLEEARLALNELTEALKNAQEQATLAATAYEEERQANTRLKAELLENKEREKALMDEVDKAQEAEMQLRIELQEAIITGNQLREAVANAEGQLAQFEAMFKQYDAALNQQVTSANAFSEQMQAAKAELASAEEEKQSLESKLTAAHEAAQALAQRFTKEINDLRSKLDEETLKRQNLEQELLQANETIQTLQAQPKGNPEKEAALEAELAQLKTELAQRATELAEAQSTISQLRADWEQADREVERLESDVKILESSVQEKSAKLHEAQKNLKAKERQLVEKTAILDALNLAIVMVSVSGEIHYWNEAAAVFHAIPAGEALGKKSDEVMKYKYASSKERKAAMESLQSVGRWDGKIKYLTPDGEQKIAEMFISRLDDEVGNPIGILTVLTDITKRVTVENEHRDFKQHIEPMLNAMPVSLITFDDAGIITNIFGKPIDQHHAAVSISKGKSIYELYGKYPSLLGSFRRVLSGEAVVTSLALSESQVDFHFSPMLSNGLVVGAVGVLVEAKSPVEQA